MARGLRHDHGARVATQGTKYFMSTRANGQNATAARMDTVRVVTALVTHNHVSSRVPDGIRGLVVINFCLARMCLLRALGDLEKYYYGCYIGQSLHLGSRYIEP